MKMFHNPGVTGKAIYAVCNNDAGQAWKPATSSFVTYTTTRSDFAITLPEIGVTGNYGPVSPPGTGAGRTWTIYQREGGSPSHANDLPVGYGFEAFDTNVKYLLDSSTDAGNLTLLYGMLNLIDSAVGSTLVFIGQLAGKIGPFTGGAEEATNSVYGFLRAMVRKDLTAPTQVGGTFTPTTDSMEAQTDGSITVKEVSTAGMAKFSSVNTLETVPVAGSVAKLSQGAADPETFFDAPLGILADHPAGSMGERLLRVPNAVPGANGGLPTVDGSNRVAGVQSAANITSTGAALLISASGHVTANAIGDKTGYALSAGGDTSVAAAVAANASIATGLTDSAAAKTAAQASIYVADIFMIKDSSQDEYTIQWFKDGAPVTSGITSPTIQVVKRSDGTDLIASTALTQIGATGSYKYDATTTARLADGDSAVAVVSATIDAGTRTWRRVVGKDIAV